MAKKSKRRRQKLLARAGRAASVALPVVGGVFGGVAGAAVGTVAGSAIRGATTKGTRKQKLRSGLKGLATGAAITGGVAAIGLVSGAGVASPLLSSVPRLLGLGGSPAAPQSGAAPATAEGGLLDFGQNLGRPSGASGIPGAALANQITGQEGEETQFDQSGQPIIGGAAGEKDNKGLLLVGGGALLLFMMSRRRGR